MSVLAATTFNNAIINLRSAVIDITKLPNNLVLNGDSLYGADALRMIQSAIGKAPSVQNTFIIFEFKENTDTKDFVAGAISEFESEAVVPYSFFIKIYGNECHELAQKLLTFFKFPQTVVNLRNSGVFISDTHGVPSLNEFLNAVRWPRCDLQIDVLCRFQYTLATEKDVSEIESYTTPTNIMTF